MNNKPNSDRSFLHFMLRAQQLAKQDARSDKGYAMLMTSIISIAMFSMLAAYMTMTNLSRSSTNAYVDGTNTFYAAESGLNRRAQQLREKFIGYASPTGLSPGQAATTDFVPTTAVSNCFPVATTVPVSATNDFECRNYSYQYNNNLGRVTTGTSGGISLADRDGRNTIDYTAFTFVADKTNYVSGSNPRSPTPVVIPSGQVYAGLNAQEYQYTVYATAAKKTPGAVVPQVQVEAKTVLQMDFKSRVVPLFQFAAFYKDDLEMNSTSTMTLSGRVHTNGNLYTQPTPIVQPAIAGLAGITTYFNSPITSAGNIYNRVDASTIGRYSAPRVLQSGNPITGTPTPVYYPDSLFRSDTTAATSLSSGEISAFGGQVRDGAAGATNLETPDAGFLRKRNYFNNKIGEYYAKADMRLEMVPDRDVKFPITGLSGKTTTPWTRDPRIIPFNFTSIQTGGPGICTTALPTAGSDPDPTYIDSSRNNASTLRCNVFTKGQLQSLRQPVLVLTNINQLNAARRDTAIPTTAAPNPARGDESVILNRPAFPAFPTGLSAGVTGATPAAALNRTRILRALQVALVSTPSPVTIDRLNTAFNDPVYITVGTPLNPFRQRFSDLINSIVPTLTTSDRSRLMLLSPNQIAALQGAWFMPAPVQRVENSNPVVQVATNFRNSGFYDGRERRWITMLQTNIASLSVWNRDGVYVESSDTDLTIPYQTSLALQQTAFDNGSILLANRTNQFAFTTAAATGTVGLPFLGLGANDSTEGGLVLHATVNDDLDGSGTPVAANDVTSDSATPILKQNPDGTNFLDTSSNTVTVDYSRVYPTATGTSRQSFFGFAFNGGDYLPGALTLVTDQAIYVQGNFNNNGAIQPAAGVNVPSVDRRPAAIMGDTISILSNQCLTGQSVDAGGTVRNYLGTPGGQIDCGIPNTITSTLPSLGALYYTVTGPTAVNAAFLSSTNRSCGNLGPNRTCTAGARYSGGLNNYMRMLEDWGSIRNFNYSGSFVSLGTPLEYNGPYLSGGNYYNIPVRNYNFENNFNSFSLLPPLSPSAIYLQQDVFKRTFN